MIFVNYTHRRLSPSLTKRRSSRVETETLIAWRLRALAHRAVSGSVLSLALIGNASA
jgi:hypothetical protein